MWRPTPEAHDVTSVAAGRVCVLAPAPMLTIALESTAGSGDAEIHLHPGGQGFWIARLICELGVDVALCATFGGETGRVVRGLLEAERMTVRAVESIGVNGAYVDDRRTGERVRVGTMVPPRLSRHDVDALYGAVLVEGLDTTLTVLGGPDVPEPILPAEIYRRLATDLVANGRMVVADLSGEPLAAAVEGGATVIKVSHEELLRDGLVADDSVAALVEAMRTLAACGQWGVVCSRAERPALAIFEGRSVEVRGPVMEATDPRGAGDSFTAALAASLAIGRPFEHALRMGAAAGGLNVTRRGLGTGARDEIERLADHVEVRDLHSEIGGIRCVSS